jgi:hypothetical protein
MDADAIEMLRDFERRTRDHTGIGHGICKADVRPRNDRCERTHVGRRVGGSRSKR